MLIYAGDPPEVVTAAEVGREAAQNNAATTGPGCWLVNCVWQCMSPIYSLDNTEESLQV